MRGLKASDFEIFDNGVPQKILDIGYEKLPTDVTVLLDVSESVTGPMLNELRRGVRQLREGLESRDRLKLVTFNMGIRRLADFAGPAVSADAAFESLAGCVLYFSPHGVRGGGLHTLDVRVKRDGVDVRARRAYVWQ